MTNRIHIGKNGPAKCDAQIRCRLTGENGEPAQHFDNWVDAGMAYEDQLEKKYGATASVTKLKEDQKLRGEKQMKEVLFGDKWWDLKNTGNKIETPEGIYETVSSSDRRTVEPYSSLTVVTKTPDDRYFEWYCEMGYGSDRAFPDKIKEVFSVEKTYKFTEFESK